MSDDTSSRNPRNKLGPIEKSFLEYVLATHMQGLNRRASILSLLLHSQLLARGARPLGSDSAVVNIDYFKSDPIRLSYNLTPRPKHETFSSASSQLQLSVAETDSQIFVSLTDTTTDKFGHLELSGVEHVKLDTVSNDQPPSTGSSLKDFRCIFLQLDDLLNMVERDLMNPVLPSPPLNRAMEADTKREKSDATCRIPEEPVRPHYPPNQAGGRPIYPLADYGRSDLDPLGGGMFIGPGGRSSGGIGGMLMDPRHPPFGGGSGSIFGGPDLLPPGSVPPGARFDPFGPGVMPPRSNLRPRQPDPDHALPPGYEDMYL